MYVFHSFEQGTDVYAPTCAPRPPLTHTHIHIPRPACMPRLLPKEDAVVVQVLKAQGALVYCRTNVPQTMLSYECCNPVFGQTSNPYHLKRGPGERERERENVKCALFASFMGCCAPAFACFTRVCVCVASFFILIVLLCLNCFVLLSNNRCNNKR